MHRIIKAHLDSFIQSRGLEAEEESAQFEKFSNFSIISSISSASFDLDDVTTGAGEDGIDGIAIIIDEEVVISAEDAKAMFQSTRRNHEVDVICIQSKRSEGFDLGDFLKFKEAILRFANQTPYACTDDTLRNAREIFDVIVENVPKIRNGRPNLTARYVATGLFQSPAALVTAMSDFKPQVNDLGLFDSVDGKFIDRDELTRLWVGTYSGTDASLDLFSNAALPTIAGIDEAYLAVVRASDFVENLLTTEDDNLRTQVFEENVRSFLGLDNSVNLAIQSTLQSGEAASRFPVLNNGIDLSP